MRWVVLAVAATLALVGVAQAAAPSLSYRCTPGSLDSCAEWYRVPVEVTWVYNTGDAEPIWCEATAQRA